MNQHEYAKKVAELEAEGICTSDAQAIVDAEIMQSKVKIQIASAMDDCGTNEIKYVEMTKTQEREYNEGMAKLAEYWG